MRFLLMLALLACSFGAWADDWELDSTRNGIVSYTRNVPGQLTLDFKAVVRIKADLLTVASAVMDVEHLPDWFYHMKETKVVGDKDLDNLFLYLRVEGIGPVVDRDVIVKAEVWQDPISHELQLEGHSIDYPQIPPKSGIVRIPQMTAGWRITPITPEITEVELSGSADPGGVIPAFASNMVVTVLPRESLDKLRSNLGKSSYREELGKRRDADARWARLFSNLNFNVPGN